jgi:hypothetical protein
MTRRDILARGAGVVAMAAGGGACLWLRALMQGPPHEPSLLEAALVLASFLLTLGGVLLLLNGESWVHDGHVRRRPGRDLSARRYRVHALDHADDRARLADVLARRAARRRRN